MTNSCPEPNVDVWAHIDDPYLTTHLEEFMAFHDARRRESRPRTGFRAFRSMVHDLVAAHANATDRILDVGCGDGELLGKIGSESSFGIDIDRLAIQGARAKNPEKQFLHLPAELLTELGEERFDLVVMSGVLEQVYDVHTVLGQVQRLCTPRTRVVVTTFSKISQPFLRITEIAGLRRRPPLENWVPPGELVNLLEQNGFEVIEEKKAILVPFRWPLVGPFANRWLAPLPFIRHFCMVNLVSARARRREVETPHPSVSIVIAARNERGNIGPLLDRIPRLADRQQVIFVEGNSTDDTFDEILAQKAQREAEGYPYEILALQQPGVGKADAVRTGFDAANGDILIILDADISVPPEELPRFIEQLTSGNCEFANGSRLVYPMEQEAMRFLNLLGNRFFGALFTYLLGQSVRDTLCGTKALWATDYQRIVEGRAVFGEFDPFGDFDLLFGAARLGLKIRDVPVHYKERTYGSTNISRFRHGLLLLKMSAIAARRLKFR